MTLTWVSIGAVVSLFPLRFVIGRSDFFGDFFGFDCAEVLNLVSSQFVITERGMQIWFYKLFLTIAVKETIFCLR